MKRPWHQAGWIALGLLALPPLIRAADEPAEELSPQALLEFQPDVAGGLTPPRVRREVFTTPVGNTMRLNLAPGSTYEGRVTSVATTAFGSRTVGGVVAGHPASTFLAVEHGTATAAAVWISPVERYALDGQGVRILRGLSTSRCACALDFNARRAHSTRERPTASVVAASPAIATGPASFDVLIVYTPAALHAAGSADALTAQAELAMADANTCYQNSGLSMQGRIVGVHAVDYAESGEIRTDLHRLATPDDGFLDDVQTLRDETEADFVCLFTDHSSADGYEGYAEILTELKPAYEQLAFSVVNVKSAAVEHLFAHELGHNMGCDHDRENTTGLQLFDFSHGWRFTGSDGKLYRDVMAYAPGVSVPFFGSPLVSYLGTPTGVADYADTARTLAASAPTFVNFRAADGRGQVAVRATVAQASVDATGAARAAFQFERTGSTGQPLTVFYEAGGSASGGNQYAALPGSMTIPAGRHYASLRIRGLPPATPFGSATVTLALQPADAYVVAEDPPTGATAAATVTLLDRLPLVNPGGTSLNKTGRKLKFRVNRTGPTDAGLTVRYTLSGSAQAGADYDSPDGSTSFAPGETTATIKIGLLPSRTTGRTVHLDILPDPGYNVGNAGVADFELP